MSRKTTIEIGFQADTSGLKKAERDTSALQKTVERLSRTYLDSSMKTQDGIATGLDRYPRTFKDLMKAGAGLNLTGQHWIGNRSGQSGFVTDSMAELVGGYTAGRMLRGGAGLGRSVASKLPGIGLAVMGAMGLAGGARMLTQGMERSRQYTMTLDEMSKKLLIVNDRQAVFSTRLEKTARYLNVSRNELIEQANAYMGLVGAIQGADRLLSQTKAFGGFARGSGLNVGQTLTQFGVLGQAGAYGQLGGGLKAQDLAFMAADAISQSGMRGRETEMLEALQNLVALQGQALTRPVGVPAMLEALGVMGSSKVPGLMGGRGAAILNTFSSGIMNPGAGAYGEFMMSRALGEKNFYRFKMLQEEGAFGRGPSGDYNIVRVMDYLKTNFKDDMARAFAARQWLPGMSMHQYSAFEQAFGGFNPQERSGFINDLEKIFSPKQMEAMDFRVLPTLAAIYRAKTPEEIAGLVSGKQWGGMDKDFMADSGTSLDYKKARMMAAVAGHGYKSTDQEIISGLAAVKVAVDRMSGRFWTPIVAIARRFGFNENELTPEQKKEKAARDAKAEEKAIAAKARRMGAASGYRSLYGEDVPEAVKTAAIQAAKRAEMAASKGRPYSEQVMRQMRNRGVKEGSPEWNDTIARLEAKGVRFAPDAPRPGEISLVINLNGRGLFDDKFTLPVSGDGNASSVINALLAPLGQ